MPDFGANSRLIWTLILAAALWWPVRNLIWVLSVRRAQAKAQGELPDEATREALKRRAAFTSALLCFLFAYLYVGATFSG
jgi:HEAT repeat protein